MKDTLSNLVYDCLSIDEFEVGWSKMIEEYGLEDNAWLSSLYEDRDRWIPVFVKDMFWAGMSTTQRSEGMNAYFDDYLTSKTTLKQFVQQYESALRNKHEKEALEDFYSLHGTPQLMSPLKMEEQLSKLYTINMFRKFQDELKQLI